MKGRIGRIDVPAGEDHAHPAESVERPEAIAQHGRHRHRGTRLDQLLGAAPEQPQGPRGSRRRRR